MSSDETRRVLVENMRFYADMRFKQLTLLMAGLTLAGAGVAHFPKTQLTEAIGVRSALAVLAMVFIAVLWVMEVRAALFWVAHREQVGDLWPQPAPNPMRWLNATNSLLVLYAGLYFGWLWLGWQWLNGFWSILCLGIGLLVVTLALRGYRQLWKKKR